MAHPIVVGLALREDDAAPLALGRDLARLLAAPPARVHAYPPIAEEDARLGDHEQALRALDAAAALHGGVLPSDLAERRADWAVRAGVEPGASRRPLVA